MAANVCGHASRAHAGSPTSAPQDIAAYVVEATQGASAADPFEGMSPEEINEYLEAQQRGTRR